MIYMPCLEKIGAASLSHSEPHETYPGKTVEKGKAAVPSKGQDKAVIKGRQRRQAGQTRTRRGQSLTRRRDLRHPDTLAARNRGHRTAGISGGHRDKRRTQGLRARPDNSKRTRDGQQDDKVLLFASLARQGLGLRPLTTTTTNLAD